MEDESTLYTNIKRLSAMDKKRQHYIPQHFLKNFSLSDNRLYVFPLSNGRCYPSEINNIAKEDFFYGNDIPAIKFENNLSISESWHSEIIKKIIKNYSLNSLNNDDYLLLRTLILFQESRTKSAKIFSVIYSNFQTANGKIDINHFKKLPRNVGKEMGHPYRTAFGLLMQAPILSHESISDLKMALLINITNKNFICGDAPTVRFNQLKIKNERLFSLFSPGLEIFYPLNNELLLLFYDPKAYDIEFDFGSVCYVNKLADIDALNKLQLINALEFVLFSDITQRENVEKMYHEIQMIIHKNVKKTFGSFEKGRDLINGFDSNYWNLFCFISKYFNYKLNLSFIHRNLEYEQYWLKKYNDAVKLGIKPELVRDEDLKKRVYEKIKEEINDTRTSLRSAF